MWLENFYWATIFSCLDAVALGAILGYTSPALLSMSQPDSGFEPIDDDQKSWIASIVAIGAVFGGLAGGTLIDKFGRKTVLIYSAFPITIGWLLAAFSGTYILMLVGRTISGVVCGVVILAISVYIAETAPARVRGFLSSGLVFGIFLGVLLTYMLGLLLNWFWLAIALSSIALLCSVTMAFMPESPRWLIKEGCRSRAMAAISFLDPNADPESEYRDMEKSIMDQPQGKITIEDFKSPSVWKPFLLTMTLMNFQQWCGFNGVLFFTGKIFKDAGYDTISPEVSSIILAVAETGGTLLSCFIIDRAGRKLLLFFTSSVMVISLTILASFSYMITIYGEELNQKYGFLNVLCLGTYATSYAMGFGPIPWVIMGEVLPVRVRGICGSIATAFVWGMAFVVVKTFNDLRSSLTVSGAYLFYDIMCVIACFVIAFFMPETKGKSLEEIANLFEPKSNNKMKLDENDII